MKARRKIIIGILMRLARKHGVKIVIKKTFEEVGNARSDYLDVEREVLKEAIAYAKAHDCVLVAISVDRFFRPKEFTIKNPFVPVTIGDAERFKSILNDDAVVATIIRPGFDKRRLKGVYGKWGQEAKGMKGGRPPKKMPLKERREKFKPIARQLRRNGMSYKAVCQELNATYEELKDFPIAFDTVVGWIKDIKR